MLPTPGSYIALSPPSKTFNSFNSFFSISNWQRASDHSHSFQFEPLASLCHNRQYCLWGWFHKDLNNSVLHKPHTKYVTDHTQCLADFTNGNNPVLVCGTFISTYGTKLVWRTHISGCNVGFNNPEKLICSVLWKSKTINQPINLALLRDKRYSFLSVKYALSSAPIWLIFTFHLIRFSHTFLRPPQKKQEITHKKVSSL